PPAGAKHLCYCHSPARYVWEQTADYGIGSGGLVRRVGLRLIGERFRRWDRATASRVTRFVANSAHSAARVRRCFGCEAGVVHPPVRTDVFTPGSAEREEWFLVVAALEPYKRTDLAIDAANRHGFRLKVVGGGSQAADLQRQAGPTVEMMGRVSDEALLDLYRRAQAMIFPQVEDFGITAVEAQAAGCPLIAFRAGGAEDILAPETGVFFDEQSTDALVEAVRSFDAARYPREACRANAERFSEAAFDEAMRREVEALLHR
ncbi:MAG: glycosyltransferase, partial [Planctomycetota bacterium]